MIAAVATTRPAAEGLRVLRDVVRADAVRLMLPVKAAWCCQHVCASRYADDMRRLVASRSVSGWSWSGGVFRSVGAVCGCHAFCPLPDARTYTVVAVVEVGRQPAPRTTPTTTTAGERIKRVSTALMAHARDSDLQQVQSDRRPGCRLGCCATQTCPSGR
jgi:hypothetical protein